MGFKTLIDGVAQAPLAEDRLGACRQACRTFGGVGRVHTNNSGVFDVISEAHKK